MPCVKRSLLALAAVALLTFFPKVTFAASASTCECFCGESGYGATDMGVMTSSACQTTCTESDIRFVGCFTDPQSYPDRNPKCWTSEQCDSWSGYSGVTLIGAEWAGGDMPYDCARTKTSLSEQKYCYADDAPYTLNVQIGSITEVANLPTYINTIYTWLLPAASLLAVVMMMLGGLQYVLSRGKSKYIEKAKSRITNAITGLVILLSIFVILNLIDPRLTSLNALRIPMIKEVTLLDAMSSCERLSDDDVGYDVTLASGVAACGGTGTISDDSGLVEGAIGSWKKGDMCDYMACKGADAGKSCVREDGVNVCKSCVELPSPSESTCKALDDTSSGGTNYCVYNATSNSCTAAGTSLATEQGISCPGLLFDATQDGKTAGIPKACGVYEDLDFMYSIEVEGITSSTRTVSGVSPLGGNAGSSLSSELLRTICTKDPCGVADAVGADRCVFNSGSGEPGYVEMAINVLFGTDYGTTGYYCHTF